ncbi:hypothetical protein K501DRAFT_289193 [Backusella circina FSU 941]|nr:hypothetical protein K501DRAFT_289193 [Backusella circina FSU 941]
MTFSDTDSWEKYEDDDDLYSPPSSPPPPHIILYPENYHAGSGKSWQHDYAPQVPRYSSNQNTSASYQSPPTSSEPDRKGSKVASTTKFHTTVKRNTFKVFKMLLKAIFSNNNILLAVTLGNRLWRSRNSIFIKPYYRFLQEANTILLQAKHVLPNDYQEAVMLLKMVRSIALHYYAKSMSHTNKIPSGTKGNKHVILFMLSNLQRLYKLSIKLTNKWITQAVKGIGGLDALILAIGAITFTKYLQRSNRIF